MGCPNLTSGPPHTGWCATVSLMAADTLGFISMLSRVAGDSVRVCFSQISLDLSFDSQRQKATVLLPKIKSPL